MSYEELTGYISEIQLTAASLREAELGRLIRSYKNLPPSARQGTIFMEIAALAATDVDTYIHTKMKDTYPNYFEALKNHTFLKMQGHGKKESGKQKGSETSPKD